MSSKAAERVRSRREDEYVSGYFDPWATRSDLSVAVAVAAFKEGRRKKLPSTRAICESILSRFTAGVGPRTLIAGVSAGDVSAFLVSTRAG